MIVQMTLQEALIYFNFISQKKNRTSYENIKMMMAFNIISNSGMRKPGS